jgi:hypothetical protein
MKKEHEKEIQFNNFCGAGANTERM